MRRGLGAVAVLLAVVAVLASDGSAASLSLPAVLRGAEYVQLFATRIGGAVFLGVFQRWGVVLARAGNATRVAAVYLPGGGSAKLVLAEVAGIDAAAARLIESGDHFAVFDGRVAAVWNSSLGFVGRFASDSLKGLSLLPSGNLVAWGRDYVAFARAPGYTPVELHDVWLYLYDYLWGTPPEEWVNCSCDSSWMRGLQLLGYDVFDGHNLDVARQRLGVDVESAIVLPNGTLLVAANVWVGVKYADPGTGDVAVAHTDAGVLVRVHGGVADVVECYTVVEKGVPAPAMAYSYRPYVKPGSQLPGTRLVRVVSEDGWASTVYAPLEGELESVRVVGDVVLAEMSTGVALVARGDRLLWSLAATRVVDAGAAGGVPYVAYSNAASSFEVGAVDVHSGRVDRLYADLPQGLAGVYVAEGLDIAVAAVNGEGYAEVVGLALPRRVARLGLRAVDPRTGAWVQRAYAEVAVHSTEVSYAVSLPALPAELPVPAPSTVEVRVWAPHGRGGAEVRVESPGAAVASDVEVMVQPYPVHAVGWSAPDGRPAFYSDGILVDESEVLRLVLPPADDVDGWGVFVATLAREGVGGPSVLRVFRLDGSEVWRRAVPGVVDGIRALQRYLVARRASAVEVYDLASGAMLGTVHATGGGYDVDADAGILVAWSRGGPIGILDLRTGLARYLTPPIVGDVAAVAVVGGTLYAYAEVGNEVRVYVVSIASGSVVDSVPLGAGRVVGFATDGRFKAVSYGSGNDVHTVVLSAANGAVVVPVGPVLAVRWVGTVPPGAVGRPMRGAEFAVLAVHRGGAVEVYAVGLDHEMIAVLQGVSTDLLSLSEAYLAECTVVPNATPVLVLRDMSGAARVMVRLSSVPKALVATEQYVAYATPGGTHVIERPRVIGRYSVMVVVVDGDTGQPVEAEVAVEGYGRVGVARGGMAVLYTTTPRRLRLRLSAEMYATGYADVELTDASPSATVVVRMVPVTFSLRVNVVTPEGERVRTGTVRVRRADGLTVATLDLSKDSVARGLRPGVYRVEFESPLFTRAEAEVAVESDASVTLLANRTGVRVCFAVYDQYGNPVGGAEVLVESGEDVFAELETGGDGATDAVTVPYGANLSFVARARGYATYRGTVVADASVDGRCIPVTLLAVRGRLTVTLRDAGGRHETAVVSVATEGGAEVIPAVAVHGSATFELGSGTYVVRGTTPDGRTATAVAVISDESPEAAVSLVFPAKAEGGGAPVPFHIVLVVVAVAVAGVAVYKKFFARRRATVVVGSQ